MANHNHSGRIPERRDGRHMRMTIKELSNGMEAFRASLKLDGLIGNAVSVEYADQGLYPVQVEVIGDTALVFHTKVAQVKLDDLLDSLKGGGTDGDL